MYKDTGGIYLQIKTKNMGTNFYIFKKGIAMNIIRLLAISAAAASGVLSASCTKEETGHKTPSETKVTARLAGFEGESQWTGEDGTVTGLQACLFEDGRISRTYSGLTLTGGACEIQVDSRSGNLYLMAGTEGLIDLAQLQDSGITEEEWLKKEISDKDGKPVHFFSGSVSLSPGTQAEIPASLRRGIARFDLQIRTAGETSVSRVTLKNAARSAFLFPIKDTFSPEGVSRNSLSSEFREPLTSDTKAVLYVYEQANDGIEIEVEATVDGKPVVLTRPLSGDLKRNTIYTVTVRKDTIDISIEVSFEDWEEGTDTELVPGLRGL